MAGCKHEHTKKMWSEESYRFMGFMITQCVDCGCRVDAQWYQSDDCGEHWRKINDPMEGKQCCDENTDCIGGIAKYMMRQVEAVEVQ